MRYSRGAARWMPAISGPSAGRADRDLGPLTAKAAIHPNPGEIVGPGQAGNASVRYGQGGYPRCYLIGRPANGLPKSATSPTTNDNLAAFERNPYIMGIKYRANDGGLRWQPSTFWQPSKTANAAFVAQYYPLVLQ